MSFNKDGESKNLDMASKKGETLRKTLYNGCIVHTFLTYQKKNAFERFVNSKIGCLWGSEIMERNITERTSTISEPRKMRGKTAGGEDWVLTVRRRNVSNFCSLLRRIPFFLLLSIGINLENVKHPRRSLPLYSCSYIKGEIVNKPETKTGGVEIRTTNFLCRKNKARKCLSNHN